MHADLSILALSRALYGEYSWPDICMHIYIGKSIRSLKISSEPTGQSYSCNEISEKMQSSIAQYLITVLS